MQICTYTRSRCRGVRYVCAARFDIRYTFTIAQAIDTSLHRYRCLVQSEFFVLRALHTPWYTPSRVGEHRVVWLSFDLLSPSFSLVSVIGGRTRRRTRFLSPFFLSPPLLLFFFLFLSILYFCVYLCRSRPREVERRRGGARHEGGGIYFCNEILPLRSIGNCTWTVHAHSPRVDSLRVRLGDKDSNRVKFIFTKKCSLIFTFKLAEFARKNLSFVFSIFDEMVNLDWSEWIVR